MSINRVKELDPAFSYHVDGGDIYVYLVRTEIAKMTIITFGNTSDEWAFAIQTLTSNSQYKADELVKKAYKEAVFFSDNPFRELLDNDEAMERLAGILARFFDGE